MIVIIIVSFITNNVVNRLNGDNRVNTSNFLNNKCVNIYVTRYRLYNFLLGRRFESIINFEYKKEWDLLFNSQIIFGDHSKNAVLDAICVSLYRNHILG